MLDVHIIMKDNLGIVSQNLWFSLFALWTCCWTRLDYLWFQICFVNFESWKVIISGTVLVAWMMPFSLRAMSFSSPLKSHLYFFQCLASACIAFAFQVAPNGRIAQQMYSTEWRCSGTDWTFFWSWNGHFTSHGISSWSRSFRIALCGAGGGPAPSRRGHQLLGRPWKGGLAQWI